MDRQELQAIKERAEALLARGLYDAALDVYADVRQFGYIDPKIYLRIGDIYLKLRRDREASDEYELAAEAYADRGFIVKAIAICKMILSLDPSRTDIEDRLAAMYSKQSFKEEAEEDTALQEAEEAEGVSGTPGHTSLVPDEASAPAQLDEKEKAEPGEGVEFDYVEFAEPEIVEGGVDIAYGEDLKRTPLFSDLSLGELQGVIKKLKLRSYGMGDYVFRREDEGASIFVITSGAAEEISFTKYGEQINCTTLMEGDFFGEHSYFSCLRRNSDVRVVTDLEVLEIEKHEMAQLGAKHPHISHVLFNFYKERVLDRILASSKIFRHLSQADRKEMLEKVRLDTVTAGTDIVKVGDEFTYMYLISSGNAEVWKIDREGKRRSLVRLVEGDYFGEVALLLDTKRVATVTALGDMDLMVFTKEDIESVFTKYPVVKKVLEGSAKKHAE